MTTLEATTKSRGARRIASSLLFATSTLLMPFEQCRAHDTAATRAQAEQDGAVAVSGVSVWLKARLSQTELEELRASHLRVESYYCSCYDKPKHYPYSIVLLKTPRGDLVARPEGTDGALSFTPLAVRYGDRYCELGSETDCYGSFSHPCEFTDFRYGPYLAEFFPTCKSD